MHSPSEFRNRWNRRAGIALLLAAALHAPAQTPAPVVPDRPLRLADCLTISQQRQPSLVVARARLAAAQTKVAALDSLGGLSIVLRKELPVRRQQARLGVDISQADLNRLEVENRYVVTRAYLSVLYARAQQSVLDDLIEELTYLRNRIKRSVERSERPEWTAATVDLVTLYLRRAEARRAEAERGVQMSLAALREAMNIDPLLCLNIADEPIPQPAVRVCREEILAAALARRGESIEANVVADVAGLEIDAQAKSCRRGSVRTFAAGADLHASHVPQPIYGEEFRPGGIPLAMPTVLAGPRAARVESARELGDQAAAVAQKTRNLIALETDEAYFSWEEWSRKAEIYREAEEVGRRLTRRLREEVRGTLKRVIEGILPESLLAAQTRTDYNEALFRRAIALAALERVTGGAFCAGLANTPAP
ncbi:MAG TPA: TolC family protein [Gemmataceae bacterium]|jgi:outer membrane protein TolC